MKNLIRVILFPLAASLALVSFAFADETKSAAGATTETTHDVSHNPITGNTTETTKTESKMKNDSMSKKSKTVNKKKFNKDGEKIKEENDHSAETQQH